MSKGQSKYRNQVPNWISFEIEIDRLHGTGKIIPNRSKSRVGNAWFCLIALMAKCYVIFHASRIMNDYMNNYMNNHTLPSTYPDILQTCSNFSLFFHIFWTKNHGWASFEDPTFGQAEPCFSRSHDVSGPCPWTSTFRTELRKKWSKKNDEKHLTVLIIIIYHHI